MPHAGLLADCGERELPLLDTFATPLRMLELRSKREPAVPDRVDGEADDVFSGRLEDAVRAVFPKARIADAGRGETRRAHFEVRIQGAPYDAEGFGVDTRRHG